MKIKILKEIFYVLTFTLIIFAVLEILCSNLVLAYININVVLLVWLLIGIVIVVSNDRKNYE